MVFHRTAGACTAGAEPEAHPRAVAQQARPRLAGELLQEGPAVPVLVVTWPGRWIAACRRGRLALTVSSVAGAFGARSPRVPAALGWLEQDLGARGPRPQAGSLPAPALAVPSGGQAVSQSRPGAAGALLWGHRDVANKPPPSPRPCGKGGACPHAPAAARPSVPWRDP